jgi:hypothetical protein
MATESDWSKTTSLLRRLTANLDHLNVVVDLLLVHLFDHRRLDLRLVRLLVDLLPVHLLIDLHIVEIQDLDHLLAPLKNLAELDPELLNQESQAINYFGNSGRMFARLILVDFGFWNIKWMD